MGINYQGLNILLHLKAEGEFKDFKSVVELGAQTMHVGRGGDTPELEIDQVLSLLNNKNDIRTREPGTPYLPNKFYQAIGFNEYVAIDANGAIGSLVMDLNKDIRKSGYDRQFDLVTNFGTTEHCFDQHHAFLNIHNLCAVGGIMLHSLPFQGYVNHGLYNYQPDFFIDLARANDYDVLGMFLSINSNLGSLTTYSDELMKHIHMPPDSAMALMVVLKKVSTEEFRQPYDSLYLGDSKVKNNYNIQKLPKHYLPLNLPVNFHNIGESLTAKMLIKLLSKKVKNKIKRVLLSA